MTNSSQDTPREYYPKSARRNELRSRDEWPMNPMGLPDSVQSRMEDPAGYIADDGLVDALNVALILGQPLLLTGEPGTGKTQFAYSAQYWLGFERLIRFNVKSVTQAGDFFFQIDELRRFRDAQLHSLADRSSVAADNPEERRDPLALRHYMTLGPLGEAIVRANDPKAFPFLPDLPDHNAPERSIVLIDEIDKAPRDVPNDLLNELENMEFEISEIQEKVRAPASYRPVLLITSNSERNLPDAFLRRCAYYHIPFPGEIAETLPQTASRSREAALRNIIASRLPDLPQTTTTWIGEALELFHQLRNPSRGVQKRPGTAELLNWLLILHQSDMSSSQSLKDWPPLLDATLPVLMKSESDRGIARRIVTGLSNV